MAQLKFYFLLAFPDSPLILVLSVDYCQFVLCMAYCLHVVSPLDCEPLEGKDCLLLLSVSPVLSTLLCV